ncbi:unnamed protein product [Prorocentrum cordatum]|uniref:Uncharacterized protein n=1 Tax=Prorocentrum cordatum TaxID=2364126 RepID=A0ABN9VWP5_9DINO|nr:unnamed protein product [Polarella glacialis]
MIMKDNRVARTAPALRSALADNMEWIRSLPTFVYKKLGALSGVSWRALQSTCVRAAHKAVAFFNFRVLSVAESLPWTLVRGDVGANLSALKAGPRPSNRTAGKVWDLLQLGAVPLPVLQRTVELLGDAPWSTVVVEQMHGSIAALSRFHPEYELVTLLSRTMCLFLHKLTPKPSVEEKHAQKLETKLGRLDRKQPGNVSGKHAFVSGIMATLAKKSVGESKVARSRKRNEVIKKIGKKWRSKPRRFKRIFKRIASVRASVKIQGQAEIRAELVGQLAAARAKLSRVSDRPPLSFQSAYLTEEDFSLLDAEWDAAGYSRSAVASSRRLRCEAPPMMSDVLAGALRDAEEVEERAALPAWAADVAARRSSFEGVAFVVRGGAGDIGVGVFMFAMQQPVVASFCEAVHEQTAMPILPDGPEAEQTFRAWGRHRFKVDWTRTFEAERFVDVRASDVDVYTGLEYSEDCVFVSAAKFAVPLDIFISRCSVDAPAAAGRGSGAGASAHRKPKGPAASQDRDSREKLMGCTRSAKLRLASSSSSSGDSDLEELDMDVADAEAMWKELQGARAALDQTEDSRFDDFRVVLRGNIKGEVSKKGSAQSCHTGTAIGQDVVQWCRDRRTPFSGRYGVDKFEAGNSFFMASAWCHRMQYFYNLAHRHGDPLRRFTAEEVAGYRAQAVYLEAREAICRRPGCAERVRELDRLFC